MKRSLAVIIFSSCFSLAYSQKITPTVLSNAGAVMKTANASIEWTLGELATESLKSSNSVLTQGFHQTSLTIVSTSNPSISGLDIYPNPVQDQLTIDNYSGKKIDLHIISLTGQCISEHSLNHGSQQFSLNALPAGIYVLEALSGDLKQVFTIEKIR